jgi:tetratricopeptide (TPR) repeat protein
MTKIINFPGNYQRLMDQGQAAVEAGNLALACEYYEQAYEIEDNFSLNILLSNIYLELGEHVKALELAQSYQEYYFNDIEMLGSYIHVLVMNGRFVEALQIIHRRGNLRMAEEEEILADLQSEVKRLEIGFRDFQQIKIREANEMLKTLPKRPFAEQMRMMEVINSQLPAEEFIEKTKTLVTPPDVYEFVKASLIETYVQLEIDEEIPFRWLDGKTRWVNPQNLPLFHDDPLYVAAKRELEKELENVDPVMLKMLLEECDVQFSFLYPFAEEFVSNPHDWALAYMDDFYQGEAENVDLERLEIAKAEQRALQGYIMDVMNDEI